VVGNRETLWWRGRKKPRAPKKKSSGLTRRVRPDPDIKKRKGPMMAPFSERRRIQGLAQARRTVWIFLI
jgi:hypothetical protein